MTDYKAYQDRLQMDYKMTGPTKADRATNDWTTNDYKVDRLQMTTKWINRLQMATNDWTTKKLIRLQMTYKVDGLQMDYKAGRLQMTGLQMDYRVDGLQMATNGLQR